MIRKASETEKISESVNDTNGVYIVPAFVGLGAPYWRPDVRATLVGLTRNSGREEIKWSSPKSPKLKANFLNSS